MYKSPKLKTKGSVKRNYIYNISNEYVYKKYDKNIRRKNSDTKKNNEA